MKIHKEGAVLDHFKTILRLRGIEVGRVRLPLQRTSSEEEMKIERQLRAMHIKVDRENKITC